MKKRELLLTIAGLLFICGFFALPPNRAWGEKVVGYLDDFGWQRKQLDKETRLAKRFGNDYTCSKQIAAWFEQRGIEKQVLVLLPPTTYFKKHGIEYHVPEPAVFYYYTGLKTVWANSPAADKADYFVHVKAGKIVVDSITASTGIKDSIAVFKKMGVHL